MLTWYKSWDLGLRGIWAWSARPDMIPLGQDAWVSDGSGPGPWLAWWGHHLGHFTTCALADQPGVVESMVLAGHVGQGSMASPGPGQQWVPC